MYRLLIFILVIGFLQNCNQPSLKLGDLKNAPTEATLFGTGVVSTSLYERDLAISPAGDEIVYTLGDYTQKHRFLVCIKKDTKGWGKRKVMPFSGTYQDIEPFFSMDGKKLYFASDRPMPGDTAAGDYNIWVTTRNYNIWSKPQPLDTIINGPGNEFYPAVSKNGNLYFTATRDHGVGAEDIFVSKWLKGRYHTPRPLDAAINSKRYEYNAWISPAEDILIFGSYGRKDGFGGGDLYMSRKDANGRWQQARNMGPEINTSALDFCPFIDLERGVFYFTSSRFSTYPDTVRSVNQLIKLSNDVLNGLGNIYHINLVKLGL